VEPDRVEAALRATLPDEVLLADARVDLELLEQPGTRFGADPDAVLTDVLRSSLAAAVGDVEQLLGADRDGWSWGRLHVARLRHPLTALLGEPLAAQTAVGPAPRGGSGETVGNTAYTPDFVQSAGSTFRIVVDVGSWDDSLAVNSPGQSGAADSPHYADLFGIWADDDAFPLAYSRAAVESAAEQRIVLEPGSHRPA
jgi:penicillin amidase